MATGSDSDVNFEQFDFDSVATAKNYIDKGGFGEVYGPFTWNRNNCAFKRIWISSGRPGEEIKIKVVDKKSIWTSLKHKHLIEIHNVVVRPKALYIVMEHARGGSLRNLLDQPPVHRQIDVSNWAKQIANGMLYLHENKIVHRDLKSSNIMLMDSFDPEHPDKEMTLKIIDFDEVRELDQTTTMSLRGTFAYTAPEVLGTERFSKASDVWSYGVVVWEMLTGEHPHEHFQEGAIMLKATSGQLSLSIPESAPEVYKSLLSECLHQDKYSRPSFQGVVDLLNSAGKKKEKIRSGYKSDPVFVSAFRTKASEEQNKSILGLAVLREELFVVSEESSQVDVYELKTFSFSRRWNLKELIHPQDIVSCRSKRCIYILYYKVEGVGLSMEISRVDTNGNLISNWSTGNDYGKCLSVTRESNIILTVFNGDKLNEYSSDGKLIRVINISSDADVRHPQHATKLTNGDFVISYGDVVDDLHRICVIGADGKLHKSFCEYRGSNIGQLSRPIHLSVGGEGLVMVADLWNHRVLLLDSGLELRREILLNKVQNDLRHPMAILLDELNDRLFVVDNESNNHRILIFDFL